MWSHHRLEFDRGRLWCLRWWQHDLFLLQKHGYSATGERKYATVCSRTYLFNKHIFSGRRTLMPAAGINLAQIAPYPNQQSTANLTKTTFDPAADSFERRSSANLRMFKIHWLITPRHLGALQWTSTTWWWWLFQLERCT